MEQPQPKKEQLQITWKVKQASSSGFTVMHSPVSHYHFFLLKASASSQYNALFFPRKRKALLKTKWYPHFTPLGIFSIYCYLECCPKHRLFLLWFSRNPRKGEYPSIFDFLDEKISVLMYSGSSLHICCNPNTCSCFIL